MLAVLQVLTIAARALLLTPQAGMSASAMARALPARAIEPSAEVSGGAMAFDVPSIIVGGGRIGSLLLDLGCEGACHRPPWRAAAGRSRPHRPAHRRPAARLPPGCPLPILLSSEAFRVPQRR
eukprot:scaffold26472_cov120-Isochrysis_galbana.AAC.3